MATLQKQLEKAQKLDNKRIADALFNFIKTIQDKFTELNREQLNVRSEDIFGEPLGFYSKATDELTNGKKEWGMPYDMDDTGDFLDALFISVIGNQFILFGSKDYKTPDILENDNLLSTDLFGLQDDSLRELIQNELLPFVLKFIKNQLDV